MISKYLVSFLALAASAPLAESVPAAATVLDVWAPKILYPHNGTVWYTGSAHRVAWDASNPPSQITNPLGKIYLVKDGLIQFQHELVAGFNLSDGSVLLPVHADIGTGKYQLVLIGDSGNTSDEFTIIRRI